jgi:3-hydroxyisobutyrate dehydrogenase-like beta-hydroxyacid dehydrogenase
VALGHSAPGLPGNVPPATGSSVGTALTPSSGRYRGRVLIGFVGAGLMGGRMVRNLAAAGHEVRLYARTPARAADLPATLASSVAEALSGAGLACSCVTDSGDVREVVESMLAAPSPPPVLVELSTIAPAVARELAEECAGHGVAYLDCPVSGGPMGAEAGTLAIMCGGDSAALALATPALDAIGDPDKRFHCGPVGLGLVAKLMGNLLVGIISTGTAEALGVGQRAGLDPALAREILMSSSGDSWQLRNLFPRVLEGDHRPGFTTRNLLKDLGHVRDLADGPLTMGDAARGLLEQVPPDLDYGAVARLLMELPD